MKLGSKQLSTMLFLIAVGASFAAGQTPSTAKDYDSRGTDYGKQGKYDLAISDFTKAIQLDPQYVAAYNNRGVVYKKQGKYDLSIADFATAIQINPQFAGAYSNRGLAYCSLGKKNLAKADKRKAVELGATGVKECQ